MANLYIKQLKFEFKNDGVYLSMNSDFRGTATIDEIKGELIKSGVINADIKKIDHVLSMKSTEPIRVGPIFQKYNKLKDKYIHVHVPEDGLHCFLTVRFPNDNDLTITENDIYYKLDKLKIRMPTNIDEIKRIIQNKKLVVNEIISSGVPPVNGTDAQIVYMVDIDKSAKPLIKEDGKVDYHRSNEIKCVEEDQHLAHLISAKAGKPGLNVFNEPIPCKDGNALKLPGGLNTYFSPDSCDLYSKISGHLYLTDGLINIERVYVLSHDVDFTSGDIHYNGEVIINGDVKTGFTVETDGNILINGSVEGATIKSKGGDIVIKGGILGKYKANLTAKYNLSAEFAQHAQISVGRDAEFNKYVLDCEIDAEGFVKIPKGQIIGGAVHSERGVIARELGTPKNIKTRIAMGLSIDTEAWLEAQRISKKIKDLTKKLNKIKDNISFLTVLKQRLKGLNAQKLAEMQALKNEYDQIQTVIGALEKEKNTLVKSNLGGSDFEELPFIQANYKVYPGVMIVMNQYVEEITNQLNSVKFMMKPNGVERKTVR